MHDLAVQVRELDDIRVNDANCSDPGRRKVRNGCAAKAASPDNKNSRVCEASLRELTESWQQDLATEPGQAV